jgi:Skp family chaperone for outer membrane proteins
MNIAERLQKEALARKKQEVEKFSSGYTAIRELYEQEYRENKNKLSSEIKQDIKLISQKYPSF